MVSHHPHLNYSLHAHHQHYWVMFIIMIISGLLSTMNIWADKLSDIRYSLNDLYMILLMSGWMLLFMGIFYMNYAVCSIGFVLVVFNIWAIRSQFMINVSQYKLGMIPHHSMAIHMSKKLLDSRYDSEVIRDFLIQLIKTQTEEIDYLKNN